jgi:hypothetical protein
MDTIEYVKLSLSMPQRHIRREELYLHSFLTHHYMEVTGHLHLPATLPHGKNPAIQ